jgi:hypothetical protein
MDKNKKVVRNGAGQKDEEIESKAKPICLQSDLSDMRKIITKVKKEIVGDGSFNIIFHVSLLWPVSLLNPGIKVLITLKDIQEDEDVATWERVMHCTNTAGWEAALGQILHVAKEMDLDFLIMENSNSSEIALNWLQ